MAKAQRQKPAIEPSAMFERPGLLGQILFRFFFSSRRVRPDDLAELRRLAESHRIVYVSGHKHVYNALWLNRSLLRWGLPLAGLVTGIFTLVFRPIHVMLAYVFGRRPRGSLRERAEELLSRGESLQVFLRKGPRPGRAGICPGSDEALAACLAQARGEGLPVVLVPLQIFWGMSPLRPDLGSKTLLQRIFGSAEDPGAFRSFLHLFLHFRIQRIRLGETLFASEFLASLGQLPEARAVRKLRFELTNRLERVRRVFQGPRRKGAALIREQVLRGVTLRQTIASLAAETGQSPEKLRRTAHRYLREIAAKPSPTTLRFFRWFLRHFVWFRVYDGLEVDQASMDRLRQAAAKGPMLFLPTHRSHVDYLLLSWIVAEYDVAPPCIAAGANLSFFPIGGFFRRCGAFFIRRTFWHDRLYTACLTEYLRKILTEGYNLEFFIEGTRSRTGKMYMPRIGLLKWIAEAAVARRVRNVQVVPMSVGYEKVIEERSISREAAGGPKKKEDLGALLRAGRVLTSRFGRLNLQVGKPYDLKEALAEAGALRGADDKTMAEATVKLAYRITGEIARLSAVTPTTLVSTALLVTGLRRLDRPTLDGLCRWLTDRLRANGAILTRALVAPPPGESGAPAPEADLLEIRPDALEKALHVLHEGKTLQIEGPVSRPIYTLPDERRFTDDRRFSLGYYRNGLINYLAAESVVARALLVAAESNPEAIPLSDVRPRALFLSRLFKQEFVFEVGRPFDELLDDALLHLEGKALVRGGETVSLIEHGRKDLELLTLLTQDFYEAYRMACISLVALLEGPMGRRSLLRRMRDDSEKAFYRGELTRRESCHRITFDNAITSLMDLGVLVEAPGRSRHGPPVMLGPDHSTGSGITALLDQVNELQFQSRPGVTFDLRELHSEEAEPA
ncbi:MAG: 1-acyl-sn-glycerol-3-phosphate acyltransferase [Polyangia bacterium]|jgi:glycerol-3-phosphate O-acyltransferase|nr:1-acyl-sn-glycerol-3-phosphate acyltransferase [Polyangia bacterium]